MTVTPLFPRGVHDMIRSTEGEFTTVSCSAGDWWVVAHANDPVEVALATLSTVEHVKRERLGICHSVCYDAHGHSDGCLFDGETEF